MMHITSARNKVKQYLRQMLKGVGLIVASFCLLSSMVLADWVEVTGQANIINGDIPRAREQAINQAVSYASLRAGVQFSSQQQINLGSLTQDTFMMERMGQASNIELLSESVSGNTLTVVLSVNVQDSNGIEQCQAQTMRAAIMLPQAQIADVSQLRVGQINDFPEALTKHFGLLLNRQSTMSFTRVHAKERLDNKNQLVNFKGYRIPTWLGEITDSQYILQLDIQDMSAEPVTTRLLGFVEDSPMRQFHFTLTLYHNISGEIVWQKPFATNALWEFPRQEILNAHSQRFWGSSYGQAIQSQLQQSILDLDRELNCRPLLGQIIARQGEQLIINLGRKHGVRNGDKFNIVLQKNIPDRLNSMRVFANDTEIQVVVKQVSEDIATAWLMNENATENVQIQDIAIKVASSE